MPDTGSGTHHTHRTKNKVLTVTPSIQPSNSDKPVSDLLTTIGTRGKEYAKLTGFYGLWILAIAGYILFAIIYGQTLDTNHSKEQFIYLSILIVWVMFIGGLYVVTKVHVGIMAVLTITVLYGVLFAYGYSKGYGIESTYVNKWITIAMSIGMILFIFVSFGYTQWRLGATLNKQAQEDSKTPWQRFYDSIPHIKNSLILFLVVLMICAVLVYSIVALDGNAFVATSIQFAILLLIGAGAIYAVNKAVRGEKGENGESKKEWIKKWGISVFGLAIFALSGFSTGHIGGILTSSLASLFVVITGFMSYRRITKITSWVQLVYDFILYIPCLLFDGFFEVYKQYRITPSYVYFILLIEAILIGAYVSIPYLIQWIMSKDGISILDKPVFINRLTILDHDKLEKAIRHALQKQQQSFRPDTPTETNQRNLLYSYGVSTWVYIDAQGANEKEASARYATVWDFGEKPIVEYNARTQSIRVRVKTNEGMVVLYDSTEKNAIHDTKKLPVDKSQVSIAKNKKSTQFPLQKWNHVVVNAQGGTMDVWINGELVASKGGIVPRNVTDRFRIGEQDGIQGGVKDVRFFTHTLSTDAIWRLSFE